MWKIVAAQATTMKNAITSVTTQPRITSSAAQRVVRFRNALLHHGRLQIELHPRRDGGADQSHDHDQVVRIGVELRNDGVVQRELPIRLAPETPRPDT